jgi:transposase InsO family protein
MDPESMSIDERYKCIRRIALAYRGADRKEKGHMLEVLVSQTGLHRKSLLRLLRQPEGPQRQPQRKRRSRSYQATFDDAIRVIGRSLNWVCAERMHGSLPASAEHLARFGHLTLSATLREQLATVSLSTLRRTIRRLRQDEPRLPSRRGRHLRPNALARQIPAGRIAADVDEVGHWELDLVYHGGAAPDGVYTLQMIDVRTAWSERRAIYGRSERAVAAAMEDIIARCPLPIREVHSDNGLEFLNHHLQRLLSERLVGCRFSRSRPWCKNDNRFVEQKNYTLVRAYLPRSVCLLTPAQAQELNALYDEMGLYYNLFEPVLRQTLSYVTYTPDGHARIRRCYDRARTPLVRLLETDTLSAPQAQALTQRYADTDPLLLLQRIHRRLDALVAPKPQFRRAPPSGNISNE